MEQVMKEFQLPEDITVKARTIRQQVMSRTYPHGVPRKCTEIVLQASKTRHQHVINNRRHTNRLLISLGFSRISLYVPKWPNVSTSISMEVEINHSGSSMERKKMYQQKENIMFYIFKQ